jgi:hypothetical protein
MSFCGRVSEFDPLWAMKQLANHNDLWNKEYIPYRGNESAYAEAAHLCLRYGDDQDQLVLPHFPVWYPAWQALVALEPILHQVMGLFEPYHVGGILLTRLPHGSRIRPHKEEGWHSEFYSTKVYAVLKGNNQCISRYGNHDDGQETVVMKPGEIWWANDLITHSMDNHGTSSRVDITVYLRCE